MSKKNLNIRFLILLVPFFFHSTPDLSAATQPDSLILSIYFITTADKLYHSQELPGNLELALSYYKKALQHSTWLQDVEWKLARCYWTLAEKSANQTKKAAYYAEGIRFGNEAVRKHPDISNSHAWLALIVGSNALNEGIVKSLYKRDVIKSGFEKAIELNPVNAVALIGLANWYHHVPAFLGGNQQKALELVSQVINLEPNYMASRMFKAKFLISAQKYAEAIIELSALLAVEKPSSRWEGTENKFKAQELLKKLKKMDSG